MSTDGPAFQLYEMFYKNLLFICLFFFNEVLQVKWSPLWNILGSYSFHFHACLTLLPYMYP